MRTRVFLSIKLGSLYLRNVLPGIRASHPGVFKPCENRGYSLFFF